jgi:iron(III) transport system substrate-binding protein
MRSTRVQLICGAALAAVVLTSCGGSPTATDTAGGTGSAAPANTAESVYAERSALTGQQRRDDLTACAEEEGQLSFYTSMNAEVADAVVEAFGDTFDIDVATYRASSEAILQRILQEQKANFAGNDIVETNSRELQALSQEGVLAEYRGERRELVPEAGRFEKWTATRFNLFAPAWNTELIKDVGAPTSWEDLADPKYDGMLSMEVGDYDWYLALYDYWQEQGKSEAEIDKLFSDMAQGAKIVKGHSVQAELLSAGQFALLASPYTYGIDRLKDKGAPVDYKPVVEPVIARANGVGLMPTATHPCAALLFTDWLLEEGQQVIAEENLTPSIPTGDDPLEGVELVAVDNEKLLNESETWSQKYEAVVQGGERVSK